MIEYREIKCYSHGVMMQSDNFLRYLLDESSSPKKLKNVKQGSLSKNCDIKFKSICDILSSVFICIIMISCTLCYVLLI